MRSAVLNCSSSRKVATISCSVQPLAYYAMPPSGEKFLSIRRENLLKSQKLPLPEVIKDQIAVSKWNRSV